MFTSIRKRLRTVSSSQLVIASAFMVALAGAVSLGLATKQTTHAASVRECTTNSIDYKNLNGGCGAANPTEYIKDLRSNNPSDLQTISKNFTPGFTLAPSQYADFQAKAKMGLAYKNGDVKVDGQTVLTDAWSIGRHTKSYSKTMNIAGAGTFHISRAQDVFAVNTIPVMVYFSESGTAQFVVMTPCGNLMAGKKVLSGVACKSLNQTRSTTNPNTYNYTTTAAVSGNAAISRVVYTFTDDNTTVTKTSLTQPVTHTWKKSGTVTVQVYAKVPGGHEILASVVNCTKKVTYVPPVAACISLVATALDDQKRKFRFTATGKVDQYSKLVNADFTLDSKSTVTGVTTKDAKGNIYKDYSFTDAVKHTVVAKLNFTTLAGAKSVTCQASVTPSELPKCEVPGKTHLPPDSPECAYCEVPGFETLPKDSPECAYCEVPGHEDLPKGSEECKEAPPLVTPPETPTELPHTGVGSVVGLFTGTSVAGAAAHRMFMSRRRRDS